MISLTALRLLSKDPNWALDRVIIAPAFIHFLFTSCRITHHPTLPHHSNLYIGKDFMGSLKHFQFSLTSQYNSLLHPHA